MKKFTLPLKMCLFLLICLIFMAFSFVRSPKEYTDYVRNFLSAHYDDTSENQLVKHYELIVTNSGFCRYKRFFLNGKVEYFSFNLMKFKDLDYYGTDRKGKLFLHTKGDDVIVQTFEDREEDVDSMATYLVIPLRDVEPQDLTGLSEQLAKMNVQRLAQK